MEDYRIELKLGNRTLTNHLFYVYVGEDRVIEVCAYNRREAKKIAENAGYVVNSVSMVNKPSLEPA